mgnify:CR=1 FL=1
MVFDPERWRQQWLALITAMTSLFLGSAVLIYEVTYGHDKEFAAMAIGLILGAPTTVAISRKR